jgi:hypothetical protein
MAYFRLKSFSIWNQTDQTKFIINENDYKYLKSIKYNLDDYRDIHYDPPEFYDYLINLSYNNHQKRYYISYTYEYFNHHDINEYNSTMILMNGKIIDNSVNKED